MFLDCARRTEEEPKILSSDDRLRHAHTPRQRLNVDIGTFALRKQRTLGGRHV
jgi:hypothetical protein